MSIFVECNQKSRFVWIIQHRFSPTTFHLLQYKHQAIIFTLNRSFVHGGTQQEHWSCIKKTNKEGTHFFSTRSHDVNRYSNAEEEGAHATQKRGTHVGDVWADSSSGTMRAALRRGSDCLCYEKLPCVPHIRISRAHALRLPSFSSHSLHCSPSLSLSFFLFVPLFSRCLYSPSLCFSVLVTLSVLICLSLLLKWVNQFLFFLLSRLSSPSFFCLAHRPFNPPFAFSQRVLFTVMFSFWSLVEDNRKVHSLIIRLPLILLIFVFIDSSLVY